MISSHTIDNQIALLRDYIDSRDDMEFVECYCDRGFSGTKFDRPHFMRMIADMKLGKFNCIVVKDLSRLGRNYLEAGNYMEKIFPMYGVRFICVSDGFDKSAHQSVYGTGRYSQRIKRTKAGDWGKKPVRTQKTNNA